MSFQSKKDYEKAGRLVKAEIHKWDPYSLMATDSPDDEFDGEIRSIVKQIPRIKSKVDADHAVSRTFSSSFKAENLDVDSCLEIGEKIFNVLASEGLSDT